jgi:hypothetical protein
MGDYVANTRGVKNNPEKRGPGCGTTACIAGWAALTLAPSYDLKYSIEYESFWGEKERSTQRASDGSALFVPEPWAKKHKLKP